MTLQPFTPAEMASTAPEDLPLGVRAIVAWSGVLNAAATMVEQLIDTPFVPVAFWPLPPGVTVRDFPNPQMKHPRESPEEHARRRQGACAAAAGAVMYGGTIGFDPLVSLMSIHVVRGRPGLYAEAMVALLKGAGHELAVEELTDARCVIRARRNGDNDWQRFTFTKDRATRAGYVKQNSKYNDDPQSMLYARCASIACRSIAPDVLKGIASVDEITDEPAGDTPAARSRTVKRTEVAPTTDRPAIPAQPTHASDATTLAPAGPPLPGEEPAGPEPLLARTWDQINREFVRLEVVGDGQKAARLTVISRIVGRPISQGRELTAADGQLVLDNLAGDNGFQVVADSLGHPEPAPDQPAPPVADETGGADPDADQEYDPTNEDSWGQDDAGTLPVPGDEAPRG